MDYSNVRYIGPCDFGGVPMVNVFGFAFLFSGIASLSYLLQAVFKKGKRKRALLGCAVALLATMGSLVGFSMATDSEAIEQGFLSSTDRSRAKGAGYEEAEEWAAVREQFAAQRQAAHEAEAESLASESAPAPQAQASATAEPDTTEDECRKDLICWGERHLALADVYCSEEIERQARFKATWLDGWLEAKFSYYEWLDKEKGTLTMIGDKLEFQNGFGAQVNMVYQCDVDPIGETVLAVRIGEGRL